MSDLILTLKMKDGSVVKWPLADLPSLPNQHLLADNSAHITIKPSVFLLQITEYSLWYDTPIEYIKAAYSSHPTKKQLLKVFRELEVSSPVLMVVSGAGDVVYDEHIHLSYKIIEMPLL